ncbi:hypothetical protein HMI54_005269 [Coelomomyces lativittatus]|nr:hypothetical protein HMI56_007121 [Coelomomyces lativittatus]KAJ1516220.1 hypothetical protein HMI55_002752 [Coelomomyces lativittatus]KAJ1517527.1 hypothetical protein HMI54_005269 [Coelomomyces lativittatus]
MPAAVFQALRSLSYSSSSSLDGIENVTPTESLSVIKGAHSKRNNSLPMDTEVEEWDLEPLPEPPKKSCEYSDLLYSEQYGALSLDFTPAPPPLRHEKSSKSISEALYHKNENNTRFSDEFYSSNKSLKMKSPSNESLTSSETLHEGDTAVVPVASPRHNNTSIRQDSPTNFKKNIYTSVPCPRIKIPVSTDPNKITFSELMNLSKTSPSCSSRPNTAKRNSDCNSLKHPLGYFKGKNVESKVKSWRDTSNSAASRVQSDRSSFSSSSPCSPPATTRESRVKPVKSQPTTIVPKKVTTRLSPTDVKSKKSPSSPNVQTSSKQLVHSPSITKFNEASSQSTKKSSSISPLSSTTCPFPKQSLAIPDKYATLPTRMKKEKDLSTRTLCYPSSTSLNSCLKKLDKEISSPTTPSQKSIHFTTKSRSKVSISSQDKQDPSLRHQTQLLHRLDSVVQLRRKDTLTPQLWNEVVTRSSYRSCPSLHTKKVAPGVLSANALFNACDLEKENLTPPSLPKAGEPVSREKKETEKLNRSPSSKLKPTVSLSKKPSMSKVNTTTSTSTPSTIRSSTVRTVSVPSFTASHLTNGLSMKKKRDSPTNYYEMKNKALLGLPSHSTSPSSKEKYKLDSPLSPPYIPDVKNVFHLSSQARRRSSAQTLALPNSPSPTSETSASRIPPITSYPSPDVSSQEPITSDPRLEMLEKVQECVDPPSDLIYLALFLIYILVTFTCLKDLI